MSKKIAPPGAFQNGQNVQHGRRSTERLDSTGDVPIAFWPVDMRPGLAKVRVAFDPRAATHVFKDESVSVRGFALPDCERDVPIRWRVA